MLILHWRVQLLETILSMLRLSSQGQSSFLKELARLRSFDFVVYGTGSSTPTETESPDGSVS